MFCDLGSSNVFCVFSACIISIKIHVAVKHQVSVTKELFTIFYQLKTMRKYCIV